MIDSLVTPRRRFTVTKFRTPFRSVGFHDDGLAHRVGIVQASAWIATQRRRLVAMSPRLSIPLLALILLAEPLLAHAGSSVGDSWSNQRKGAGRFRVLSEFEREAVLDRETGLVWWRAPETEKIDPMGFPHLGSASRCATSRVGGRMGWRTPSIDEILTLATTTEPPGGIALPAGHPFDVNPMDDFWTHTRVVDDEGTVAYFLAQFQDDGGNDPNASPPFVKIAVPSTEAHVWCTRGPGGSGTTAGQGGP
jgi:hypothetical protein